jgi:hypothetical protein
MLDDEFGQTPSERALLALDAKPVATTQATGGAVETESRFYIERDADATVDNALDQSEGVVLVFGPRQTGKTSLLARASAKQRIKGAAVAVSDFQALGKSEVERAATLYRTLVHSFATQLGLTYEPSWNEWIGANSNLDAMVDSLLKQTEGRVCWVMDEVDRLFGTDYSDDFFGLVRSWHNRRALEPDGPWQRMSILISYATEAHLFISDLNQSPFNVGARVSLVDFSEEQVRELGERYGLEKNAKSVYEITHGHPYLSRRAYGFIAAGGTPSELARVAPTLEGPFGDHLRQLLRAVQRRAENVEEIKAQLRNEPSRDVNARARLVAAGVLREVDGDTEFRVPAYAEFLSVHLC